MTTVDVYIPRPGGDGGQTYLLLPEGQNEIPSELGSTAWRKFFTASIDASRPDAALDEAARSLAERGFAVLPLRVPPKQWSELSAGELGDFEEPDGWQDDFHQFLYRRIF